MKIKDEVPYNVWFCADLHIKHLNILKHAPNRIIGMGLENNEDINGHDEYVINMWLNMVKRGDHVYVLGDMILSNQEESLKILHRLKSNGCIIHLIVGNHDKSTQSMHNMFATIDLIKNMTFKKSMFDFLDEDFQVVMCHYPLKSWANKCRGSLNLYGHVHQHALWVDDSDDLCLNVGLDNPINNYQLFSLEQIYSIYKNKLRGLSPNKYVDEVSDSNPFFVR